MGKRGRPRNSLSSPVSPQNQSVTLREEKTGKSANKKSAMKFNDRLKLEHLENLASWAAGESNIPSLAAFYGRRLAVLREALGVPPNHSSSSLFQCERCEMVLRPGTNCTVAAKKNKANEKSGPSYQVFSCHFCSHGNLKRETSKQQRHSKETRVHRDSLELSTTTKSNPPMPNQVRSLVVDEPVGPETPSKLGTDGIAVMPGVGSEPTLSDAKKIEISTVELNPPLMASKIEEKLSQAIAEAETDGPTKTPGAGSGRTLLDKKRKRKKPSGKKMAGSGNGGNAEAAMGTGKSKVNAEPIPFSL